MIVAVLIAGEFFAACHADRRPGPDSNAIKLPPPVLKSSVSIEEALQKRRSIRSYKNEPLTLKEISQLLWAAQGITGGGRLRTAPSAGAVYPMTIYLAAGKVEGLPPAIYKYYPHSHSLEFLKPGDFRENLSEACYGQSSVKNAPAIIIFAGNLDKMSSKYGTKSLNFICQESGHAAQNVYLQAVSLNIGTVVVGAFEDGEVKKILNLTGNEKILYLMPAGKI